MSLTTLITLADNIILLQNFTELIIDEHIINIQFRGRHLLFVDFTFGLH